MFKGVLYRFSAFTFVETSSWKYITACPEPRKLWDRAGIEACQYNPKR